MKPPRIVAVPADYQPGYPCELDAAEYASSIAPDVRGRIVAAATTAGLALSASAAAQAPKTESREQAVIAVLERIAPLSGTWYRSASFACGRDERGQVQVLPNVPISFGNSHNGVFDAGRAKQLAREMFAAFGLDAKADEVLRSEGVEVVLDGYDVANRVGFKLRGGMPKQNGMMAQAEPEAPANELSDAERERLAAGAAKVHSADLNAYAIMDGDRFTPTLAYLASIVAFLNEVTTGPDIDLGGLIGDEHQRIGIAALAGFIDWQKDAATDRYRFRLTEKATVPVRLGECARRDGEFGLRAAEWKACPKPATTRGMVTLLALDVELPKDGSIAMRVTQKRADGTILERRTATSSALMPSDFDASQPFAIVLELGPGDYMIDPHVYIRFRK